MSKRNFHSKFEHDATHETEQNRKTFADIGLRFSDFLRHLHVGWVVAYVVVVVNMVVVIVIQHSQIE